MTFRSRLLPLCVGALALAGCAREGDLVVDQGVGITAILSSCPAVGIPDYTGDITLFRDSTRRTADNIDVVATITNLRSNCDESSEKVYTTITFDVLARRNDARGARRVELPYFITVLRGGTAVVSKRVATVAIDFADGQERARASGKAAAYVDRQAASVPPEIREKITRKRKPGDPDAALDPLEDPEVKAALQRRSFEVLIGFQLTEDQLAYNVTR